MWCGKTAGHAGIRYSTGFFWASDLSWTSCGLHSQHLLLSKTRPKIEMQIWRTRQDVAEAATWSSNAKQQREAAAWSSESFCYSLWQKGTKTAFCQNFKRLSSGLHSFTAESYTCSVCSVWDSCNALHANGFDSVSVFNKTGYDTAHYIQFCGSLWE